MNCAPEGFWKLTPAEFFTKLARHEAQAKEMEKRRGS